MLTLILAGVIMTESFNYPNGLLTNEYAYNHPAAPDAKRSALWEATNGSLFANTGNGWTGVPDAKPVDALSTTGNSSSAFRIRTQRGDFGDVEVSFRLHNRGLSSNTKYPAVPWDGAHVWLRYISEYSLYAFSVNRRDGAIIIKKKVPGGASNGGTYYDLTSGLRFAVPYGAWQAVKVSALNNADGSVSLKMWINGVLRASVVDRGTGGAPIRQAGRVGLRGDNAELRFDDFVVTSLSDPAPVFSGVGSTNVQAASADIVWDTNVAADSQVEWGTTSAFGTLTPLAVTKVVKHLVRLMNLKPGTQYYYRVRSNGSVEKAVHAFTTKTSGDTTPPVVLSAGAANVTSSSADVVWTTNEPATSQVEYGATKTYGTFSTHFTTLLTSHRVKVYNLQPGRTYYYRIRGRDAAGNLRIDSVLHAFTTKSLSS